MLDVLGIERIVLDEILERENLTSSDIETYEIYVCNSPYKEPRYIGKSPILEQAENVRKANEGIIKVRFKDGRLFLL